MSYRLCWLLASGIDSKQAVNINCMTYTYWCVYGTRLLMMDRKIFPETCRVVVEYNEPTWCHFMKVFYCSTCFECYYIHPQDLATACRCIVWFRCVLVYWWFNQPDVNLWKFFIAQHVSNVITFILRSWRLYVGVLLCFGVYWSIGAVRLV